ncbi:MAG TPA: thiamine phosphate synthase [Blastocatellia bacterium]|nr:thiamine phosphate synthase [Blastocatellia bacterium]
MKATLSRRTPLVYLISDRQTLARRSRRPDTTALIDFLRAAFTAGVDLIQLRERDLAPRDLLAIADAITPAARRHGAALLINDRADLAACAGAGVHLTTRSMPADAVRRVFGQSLLIGASTHSLAEALAAADAGADFIVFGPVFETESKKAYGPPVGLAALREVVERLPIPVVALGGIKPCNFQAALETGAAGVAAISMFVEAADLGGLVRQIKRNHR